MKSNAFLFLLFFLINIFSCKKDDISLQITYPSTYHKSGLKAMGELRVFSTGGEIRDLTIISRFKEMDTARYFYMSDEIRRNGSTMDSIKFPDVQHAIVISSYQPMNCLVSQQAGSFILSLTDTTIGYSFADEFTRSVNYHLGQIKPEVYAEWLYSSVRGAYVFYYSGRHKFVLKGSGGQLVGPLIQYIQHRNDVQLNIGYVNNILQADFYKNLFIGDTVTIKESQILYEK